MLFVREGNSISEINYETLLHEPLARTVPTARHTGQLSVKLLLKEVPQPRRRRRRR